MSIKTYSYTIGQYRVTQEILQNQLRFNQQCNPLGNLVGWENSRYKGKMIYICQSKKFLYSFPYNKSMLAGVKSLWISGFKSPWIITDKIGSRARI